MSNLRFVPLVATGVVAAAAALLPLRAGALELVAGGYGAAPAVTAPVTAGAAP